MCKCAKESKPMCCVCGKKPRKPISFNSGSMFLCVPCWGKAVQENAKTGNISGPLIVKLKGPVERYER